MKSDIQIAHEAELRPIGEIAAKLGVNDYEQYGIALGYQYDLSKRTTVYTAGSYTKADLGKIHGTHADDDSLAAVEVMAGMIHRF